MREHLLRIRGVEECYGRKHSIIYRHIAEGLLPPPLKFGRVSAWPASEIERVVKARIAGRSDDEVRELVRVLVHSRERAED